MNERYIKSPLNYIGGKYKILDDIMSVFPDNIGTFVDLFGGGFNVGINVSSNKIIYNDQMTCLKDLFEYFKATSLEVILESIEEIILRYDLTKENVEGYLKLRTDFNLRPNALFLFVLSCYSFNHQIRFNNKLEFNTPFGKNRSSYNLKLKKNLITFIEAIKSKNIEFMSNDFMFLADYPLNSNDFVYCDPPYLISKASYNDGNRGYKNWTLDEEIKLLKLLDKLNNLGVRFMLSNVLEHKGQTNDILIEWSLRYNVKEIKKTYNNCNYHLKNKAAKTREVIIYNYS